MICREGGLWVALLVLALRAVLLASGCVAVLLISWAAHGGEIADCSHDRFIEAYLSKETVTIEDVEKRAAVAFQVCLPPTPTDADRAEFDDGIDQAFVEIVKEIINSKKGDWQ